MTKETEIAEAAAARSGAAGAVGVLPAAEALTENAVTAENEQPLYSMIQANHSSADVRQFRRTQSGIRCGSIPVLAVKIQV